MDSVYDLCKKINKGYVERCRDFDKKHSPFTVSVCRQWGILSEGDFVRGDYVQGDYVRDSLKRYNEICITVNN